MKGFFKKLFGFEDQADNTIYSIQLSMVEEYESNNPGMVKWAENADDGSILYMTRKGYYKKCLLPEINEYWSDAEELSISIRMNIEDGYVDLMEDAARRYYELSDDKEFPTNLYLHVLLACENIKTAEQVLSQTTDTDRFKGHSARLTELKGDNENARLLYDQALMLEPNHSNWLDWYMIFTGDTRGGKTGQKLLLKRLSENPKSWRSHQYLAVMHLQKSEKDKALSEYSKMLSKSKEPSSDVLTKLSDSLGQCGMYEDVIRMISPLYNPKKHRFSLGESIAKASFCLGRYDDAMGVLDILEGNEPSDGEVEKIAFWRSEIKGEMEGSVEVEVDSVVVG